MGLERDAALRGAPLKRLLANFDDFFGGPLRPFRSKKQSRYLGYYMYI